MGNINVNNVMSAVRETQAFLLPKENWNQEKVTQKRIHLKWRSAFPSKLEK